MKRRKLQLAALVLLSLLAAPQGLLAQIAVGDIFKEGVLCYKVTRTSPLENRCSSAI